jgi:hypothetical protein
MPCPLSINQKRTISQLARKAYRAWPERGAFQVINSELSKTACFEAWRHVEQGKACGLQSLKACTQVHYGRLVAHFQALAGNTDAATRTLARDADNDRRIARFKLHEALRERGLGETYAATICRRQYGTDLAGAKAAQLWHLVFTIRNRRKLVAATTAATPDSFSK